jgi:hypothetical protein
MRSACSARGPKESRVEEKKEEKEEEEEEEEEEKRGSKLRLTPTSHLADGRRRARVGIEQHANVLSK